MLKKIFFSAFFICAGSTTYAQVSLPGMPPKCGCPVIHLYVYDTKMDFPIDSTDEKDAYVKAQKSGDALNSAFARQQSGQLSVYRSKTPGRTSSSTISQTVTNPGSSTNGLDFNANAEISKSSSGSAPYTITVKIWDAYTNVVVASATKNIPSLDSLADSLKVCVASFKPADSTIHLFQKGLRKPAINLYVNSTKVNFPADSTVEARQYAKAQSSGNDLQVAFAKQLPGGLNVFGDSFSGKGTDDGLSYTAGAEIDRSGSSGHYIYTMYVTISDAYSKALVAKTSKNIFTLDSLSSAIKSCAGSFKPLDKTIQHYQQQIGKLPSFNNKWIGLQWQAKPDSKSLKKNKATQVTITITDCFDKTPVTKLPLHVTQTNPDAGILNASMVTTNDSGKATLIFTARNKGETSIIPSFSYTNINGKTVTQDTICCGDPVIKVDEDDLYKISMDAENTVAAAGKDIKLHGECIAALKALPDGTYMLEPTDKSRNMNITVEKGYAANTPEGSVKLIAPFQYTIPFLFTVGKMDKSFSEAHAIVYLNTTSPQSGQVSWSYPKGNTVIDIDKGTLTTVGGTTAQIPQAAGNPYAMSGATGLDILGLLMTDRNLAMQNINQNTANAQEKMAWAKRLQAHMNDPAYFKTAQGKADLQQMQSSYQQIGGNIANSSTATKNRDADIANKIKNDPAYAGSAQFQSDIGKLQLSRIGDEDITQKKAMAEVAPGFGTVRIEGTFEPKSMEAFTGNLESTVGPMNTSIKITVEKLDD